MRPIEAFRIHKSELEVMTKYKTPTDWDCFKGCGNWGGFISPEGDYFPVAHGCHMNGAESIVFENFFDEYIELCEKECRNPYDWQRKCIEFLIDRKGWIQLKAGGLTYIMHVYVKTSETHMTKRQAKKLADIMIDRKQPYDSIEFETYRIF